MKRSSYICIFIFSLLTGALTKLIASYTGEDLSHLEICINKTSSLNYRGPSLTSHFTNDSSTNVVLCPGDTFGDLNETYITLHNCYFALYHQGKEIWSFGGNKDEKVAFCAGSLEKDGNLALYKKSHTFPEDEWYVISPSWSSGSDSYPKMSELRVQKKQLQLVHTLQDGTQRLFYTGENIREFREDLGAPKQVAKEFLIINHTDTSDVILKRNEYIGDLNGMHLILETNCELQLQNKSQVIWSYAAYLKPDDKCSLSVDSRKIQLSDIPGIRADYSRYPEMTILPINYYTVLQSKITFQEDQLLIIQTLEDGSEIIFHNEPGQDIVLKLNKEPRKIAQSKITISPKVVLERMDYIGDLDGLHLILQGNCALTLANGQEELWKLQESLDGHWMDCKVEFKDDGSIWLDRFTNVHGRGHEVQIFGEKKNRWERGDPPTRFQLFLENNMVVLSLKYKYKGNIFNTYYAGVKTNGTWFQHLSGHSLLANAKDKDKAFPELGYVGNLDGVYAVFNKKGNWILFNKTEPIWESGMAQESESGFVLILTRDGNVVISEKKSNKNIWSTETANYYKEAKLSQSELFVNNNGLWLHNIYTDGVVKRFKALGGTNNFILVPNEEDGFQSSSF